MKKPSRQVKIEEIRRDFPMFASRRRPFVYLDSAASSQTPQPVLQAMDDYYRKFRANVHRGLYPASELATAAYENARHQTAELVNATDEEIVFTSGATAGLNLLAYVLSRRLGPGDEVVLTVMEHHSNLVPWQQLAKEKGFAVKFIGLTPQLTLDLKAAAKLITTATKVVAVTHVSNVLGTVNPVKALAALAHRRGALLIVDGAQSVGHRPVDVKELDCDFLAWSGHKMFGPTGSGALYGKKELWPELPPFLYGGEMVLEVDLENSVWNEMPWKFEAGTPNIAGAIGLGAAAAYVSSIGGPAAIARHERELVRYARKKLSAIKGLTVFGPPTGEDCGGVVSFTLGDIHPHDMTAVLAEAGVCVRGGHHCAMPLMRCLGLNGTTRASFSAYNNRADVDALVAAVAKAGQIFKL